MSLHARPIAHSRRLGFLFSSLFNPRDKIVKHNAVAGGRVCSHLCTTTAQELGFEGDELHDDAKTTEKDKALRQALSHLAKDFGKECNFSLHKFFSSRHEPVISTGSLKLDLALGIGGLPKGRIVEIYGQEASGKTTLALHIIKEAQKLGGYCAYFDVENAMDPTLAESMGVNTENLLFFRPNSAENLLSAVDTLTRSGSIDVIVVDSVAALVPKCELDEPIGSRDKDMQSRIMTQALRKLHYSLSQSKTLIVFVNQVRLARKSAKPFEPAGEVTCGGNALKFYAAVRLRLFRMGLLKTEDRVSGLGICVQVVKNKLAPAMKKAELEIQFGKGFCFASEVMDLACKHGIILQEGSNYHFDEKVFCNKCEVQQYLDEHEEVLHRVATMLRYQLFERDT